MIELKRTRYFHAPPDALFRLLADPETLATCLPRVREIIVMEQEQDWARVATRFALGPFGQFRSEGLVRWHDNQSVSFESNQPMPVQAQWFLTSIDDGGTELDIALSLDTAPLLGPLAALVPESSVASMLTIDLEIALDSIAERLRTPAILQ